MNPKRTSPKPIIDNLENIESPSDVVFSVVTPDSAAKIVGAAADLEFAQKFPNIG